jgi:hypothetical protein
LRRQSTPRACRHENLWLGLKPRIFLIGADKRKGRPPGEADGRWSDSWIAGLCAVQDIDQFAAAAIRLEDAASALEQPFEVDAVLLAELRDPPVLQRQRRLNLLVGQIAGGGETRSEAIRRLVELGLKARSKPL